MLKENMNRIGQVRFESLLAVFAIGATSALSIVHLNGTPYEVSFRQTIHELLPVLPSTALPAVKLWLVWAAGSAIVAGAILRLDAEIGLLDAILGGAAGVWMISYLLGQMLGPFGLFRSALLWLPIVLGAAWLIFCRPRIARVKATRGQLLALLSFGLLSLGLLPAQLGSPVAPYMDVLTYPAAVQRILTFHVYLPFDNDAFGCWGARAQTPALELFYAALALLSGVKLGVIAHSQLMLPMAGFIIFTTYRLGLTLADDIAGGSAALFLFFTTEFRRLTGMRGTALAFALVALGLAFLFDRERCRTRLAMGALILGLAVPSHAIDGALGMLVAAFGALLYLASGQRRRFLVTFLCLLGASLFAVPGVAIGLDLHVPYIVRIGAMLLGIVVIVKATGLLTVDQHETSRAFELIQSALIVALLGSWIYLHQMPYGTVARLISEYPLLSLFAFAGVVIITVSTPSIGASLLLLAVMLEPVYEGINYFAARLGGAVFQSGFGDIGVKLQDYWCPYFFALLAGLVGSAVWRAHRDRSTVLLVVLLILLIYPWNERFSENYNYVEHSIAEEWGIDYGLALRGFWITTEDSRWAEGPDDRALVEFLRREIDYGRVTTSTHVLHIAHDITVLGSLKHYSVFTGVDDDPVVYQVLPLDVGWIAGSRVRRTWQLPALLAARPQYVFDQTNMLVSPPTGYDTVFARGSMRLYRRPN